MTAKGVEDTAFYLYNRLVVAERGRRRPRPVRLHRSRAFHGASADRARRWPHTMLATSTHDNKRSEDVRARIDVLSEMPAAWRLALRRWSRMNRAHKRAGRRRAGALAQRRVPALPDAARHLAAGALDDAALAALSRAHRAVHVKAVREAKVHTSWIEGNAAYEAALARSCARCSPAGDNLFLDDLRAAVRRHRVVRIAERPLAGAAQVHLARRARHLPGQRDLELSLVDPDNRGPVDYALRRARLASLRALEQNGGAEHDSIRAGCSLAVRCRAKLWVALRALGLRRERAKLFADGDYRPIEAVGERAKHVVAYARNHGAMA